MEISSLVDFTHIPASFQTPLSQKQWMGVVQKCLVFLAQNDPPISSHLYKDERQVLPSISLDFETLTQTPFWTRKPPFISAMHLRVASFLPAILMVGCGNHPKVLALLETVL